MFQVFVFHEMTGYGWYMCCTYRLDQRWYRDTVALCFPYGMQRAFLLFQMDTTSARRFTAKRKAVLINVLSESFCTWFCEKIFCQLCPNFRGVRGAYVDEIRVRLAENRPQRQVQERLREDINSFRSPLNIQVLNFLCILGNEITSWLYLITHKSGKGKVYFWCGLFIHGHAQ